MWKDRKYVSIVYKCTIFNETDQTFQIFANCILVIYYRVAEWQNYNFTWSWTMCSCSKLYSLQCTITTALNFFIQFDIIHALVYCTFISRSACLNFHLYSREYKHTACYTHIHIHDIAQQCVTKKQPFCLDLHNFNKQTACIILFSRCTNLAKKIHNTVTMRVLTHPRIGNTHSFRTLHRHNVAGM